MKMMITMTALIIQTTNLMIPMVISLAFPPRFSIICYFLRYFFVRTVLIFKFSFSAEHNPWNDYPDEEESEDEDETQASNDESEASSSTSEEQFGSETVGVISFKTEDVDREDWTDYADPILEDDMYGESDVEASDDDEDIW